MNEIVITTMAQVTPAWLTGVLRRSGALTAGQVRAVSPDKGGGNWSTNAILTLSYSADAEGARPSTLFLKMVDAGDPDEIEYFGDSEVTYYTRDYVDLADAPLVGCYDGVFAAAAHRYHLLLDDLSATHVSAAQKMPTLAHGKALAEALAALHAHWWGAARLTEAGAPIHDAAQIERFVGMAAPGVSPIVAHFAADLQQHWPGLMAAIFANHPQALIERTADARGFTLIHGDAGPYNILVPREGERPLYLIDRQPFNWSLTTWLGVYDLVYSLVLRWDPPARRELEEPVLRHYHQQLAVRGVTDYRWEQLWHDYRLMVPMGVYVATEYCRGGINQGQVWNWLPMLQRSLAACDDLDSAALW